MRSAEIPLLLIVEHCLLIVLLLSAPDPVWLPGIYDDADQSDAVGMLIDQAIVTGVADVNVTAVPQNPQPLNQPALLPFAIAVLRTLQLRSPPDATHRS